MILLSRTITIQDGCIVSGLIIRPREFEESAKRIDLVLGM